MVATLGQEETGTNEPAPARGGARARPLPAWRKIASSRRASVVAAAVMSGLLQSAGASPRKARRVDGKTKVQAMVLEVYFDVNVEAKGLIFDGGIVGALADTDELGSRPESKNAVRWLAGLISKSPAHAPEWAASFNNGLPQSVVAEYMSPQHPDNPTAVAQETAEGGIANVPGAWCVWDLCEDVRGVRRSAVPARR